MRKYVAAVRSLLFVPLAFSAIVVASAAETPARRPARETLETVTVTGNRQLTVAAVGSRLGLSPKELPASLAVIPRDALLQRGDQSTAAAVARAPGYAPVGMSAFAGSALAARGFTGNNSIAQLYDGNRLFVSGGAMSFPVDTWPFERIEVLSGPASVLFGAGAIGGAVNYVPRDIPEDRSRHEAFLGLGSWDTRRLGLASAGPLSEAIGYRANAVYNATDGYVERNSNERWAVSTALRTRLRPDLTLTLLYDGGQIDDTGYFGTPLIDGRIDPRTRRVNYNVTDARTRFRNDWGRARLDWQPADGLALTNEAYYLDTTREFRNVENYTWNPMTGRVDRSFNFGTDIAQAQWGNRLDLRTDGELAGLGHRSLVGLEINRIRFGTRNITAGSTSVEPFNPVTGRFSPGAGPVATLGTDTEQAAAYAETALDLSRRLKLVAGLRAETISLARLDRITGTRVDLDFEPLTWRLGLVFAASAESSLYAQYVTGNDAAGSLISLPATNAAELQTGRQWELGAKQSFWDGRGDWTVALYHIEKDNLVSRDPLLPTVAQQIGRQTSRGVEVSLFLAPLPNLSIDLNAAVLRAEFADFNELVGGTAVSRAGNLPPNTPERLASAFATWRFAGDWEAGGGARYVGPRFSNNANSLPIPSYVVADAFLGYRWRERSVFTLRVRNLTDEPWVVAPYNAGAQWALGDPRSYELSAQFDF
ncbi:MAG: TonB-dependent siderophore receptor [Steroidobacteraceae bacterium]|nr:TonB-dependent siderophore receptor [Steroidobacteraceae bacterium]